MALPDWMGSNVPPGQSSTQMGILLSSGRLTLERQRLRLVGENFAIADAVAATLIETLERDVAVAGFP